MIFEKFDINHIETLTEWSKDQAVLQFLGGIFPLDSYINYLLTGENKLTYIVINNSKYIGMVEVEFNPKEKTADISILIAPEERKKGFGKLVLEKTLQLSDFKNYNQVDALIDPKNMASIRFFKKAGFRKIKEEVDEDGMLHLAYFF